MTDNEKVKINMLLFSNYVAINEKVSLFTTE